MTAAPERRPERPALDIEAIRRDFPILQQQVHGQPLAYLDNAATSQKPAAVIEAVSRYYREDNANIHRAVHTLADRATAAYEGAREKVRRFINAGSSREVVFTRGATEAINLVAASFGQRLREGDEILVSHLEHHANIVPWQQLCERTGATLRVIPMTATGELDLADLDGLINERTRLVSVVHVSNVFGTINPVERIVEAAHAREIPVLLDGAQATPHAPVDVQSLGCDFYVFSGHKMYGPTGIGVLYGREALLETMPPYQTGGDMIRTVSFEGTEFNELPFRFEAGTPNIAGAVGLGAAVDYLEGVGLERIAAREQELLAYGTQALESVEGLSIVGTAPRKAAVLSFVVEDMHPGDMGTILDHQGVAVRTGHHCAMPAMQFLGLPGTTRASLAFYNTFEEVDRLVKALAFAREVLG